VLLPWTSNQRVPWVRWSDRLNGKLLVERGIVAQQVDDVKTAESRKKLTIDRELLTDLQTWKETSQFLMPEDWIFCFTLTIGPVAVVLRSSVADTTAYDTCGRENHNESVRIGTHRGHGRGAWASCVSCPERQGNGRESLLTD
jgi:hypothetical protein